MEFIILTIGYFGLLGCMVYKGADLPSVLSAAVLYITSYLGIRDHLRTKKNNTKGNKEDSSDGK